VNTSGNNDASAASAIKAAGGSNLSEKYQTTQADYNYANYVVKGMEGAKGCRTIVFPQVDTTKYTVESYTISTSTNEKTVSASSASGETFLNLEGICGYKHTYENGVLTVQVQNTCDSICNVQANVVPLATKLSVSATNSALNSLLVLTISDENNDFVAEYSCVSGTISASITLEQKKTYKILATRPFGSRLEVLLDGATQSPTNFACYEISTSTNSTMSISFTLSGDGSWKNCVVV